MPLIFVGSALRAQRKRRGWSQQHLADCARLSVFSIGKFEGDSIRPSMVTFGRLVTALGCKADDLLAEVPDADQRDSDLGRPTDAWVEQMLATAPRLSPGQARIISAALFSRSGAA